MSAMARLRAHAGTSRLSAMVYTRDPDSEGILRQALRELPPHEIMFRNGGLKNIQSDLSEILSPSMIVIDVCGESEPIETVRKLIEMCEPTTRVLVLGEENDIRLYRGLLDVGAAEYLFKPLVTAVAARVCRKLLFGDEGVGGARLGRLVYVVGARGGSGSTTVAVSLASMLSEAPPRPVVMVDLNLYGGDAALTLDVQPNSALSTVLTQADRVDDLLLERGLIKVTSRLDMLASLESIDAPFAFDEDAVMALLEQVSRRYRYVVVEIPAHAACRLQKVLHMPSTLVLVSDGRLSSARDVARWRSTLRENTSERAMVHVLNQHGAPGGLPLAEFTKASGAAPDFILPYAKDIAEGALAGIATATTGSLAKGVQPIAALLGGEAVAPKRTFFNRVFG
jgi:pilus assembly protein CpaE